MAEVIKNKIRKVGNSLVISIPPEIAKEGSVYKIKKGAGGRIILDLVVADGN